MKLKKLGTAIITVVIVALVCFAGGAVWKGSKGSVPKITSDLLSEKLESISELATVDYMYTNMGKYEDVTNFYGWDVPFTKKRFIISYDGEIKAGINMKNVKAEIKGDTITVTLPEAEILSHSIDNSSLELFDETSYVFNPLKIEDYTSFVEKETTKMEESAIENGLLKEADKKAKAAIKDIVELFNSDSKEYKVVFEEKKGK